ncbi:MAG: DUF3887 domain-containing protein [Deltaproteobacteria bacterium]
MRVRNGRGRVWPQIGLMAVLLGALLLLSAPGPRQAPVEEEQADRIMIEATGLLQGIIKGISDGDYKRYTSRFSPVMKKAQSREAFLDLQKKFQKKLGKFKSMEYLGYYEQYGEIITLFKARFTKAKGDVLIKLVFDSKEGNPLVDGLWFDSPALVK